MAQENVISMEVKIDNKKSEGSIIQHKYTAGKPSPPFPGQTPTGHWPFISRLPEASTSTWKSLSSLCSLGKGPDVAVRKKHSDFSWSDF